MSLVDTRAPNRADHTPPPVDDSSVEPPLVRVSILGGSTQLDVALPSAVPIAALMGELVSHIESRNPHRRDDDSDAEPTPESGFPTDHRNRWTLSLIGAPPLPPHRSLADAGIRNGDLLMITSNRTDESPVLFDDVVDAVARLNESRFANWSPRAARILGQAAAVLASLTAAVCVGGMRAHHDAWWPAVASAGVTAALVTATALVARHRRDDTTATALAATAIPLAFATGLAAVPGSYGAAHLSLGFALALLCAVLSYRLSAAGPFLHSAALTASTLGGGAAVCTMLVHASPTQAAAVVATVGLLVVGLAPRLTIVLAKLPLPPVPTAGAPTDPEDTAPTPVVEGIGAIGALTLPKADALERRSYLANAYLTGIVAGATVITVAAAVLSCRPWSGIDGTTLSLAVIIAAVLCLRGRSHSDLAQAAILVSGGCLTLAAIVGSLAVVPGWWPIAGFTASLLALVAAFALGVIAPGHRFSPVMRRLAELGEYALVAVIVPLLVWVLDLYQTVRNL